jgi:hypothetical protein
MSVKRMMWVLMVLPLAAVGCQGAGQVAGGESTLLEGESCAAFLDRMSTQETVSENDACRGLLMLLDGQDGSATFQDRVKSLRERNIVGADWDMNAPTPVTRGRLAYMIYQATEMSGGVILTMTGPSERYCLRELQYRKVMAAGTLMQPATGLECVSVLGRADTYIRTGKVPDQAGSIE